MNKDSSLGSEGASPCGSRTVLGPPDFAADKRNVGQHVMAIMSSDGGAAGSGGVGSPELSCETVFL